MAFTRKLQLREFFIVAMLLASPTTAALTGEHVCHRVENYTVTSREQYVEPVEVHTLAWCLQIPPRCPQTRTELRERWRMKTEVKFKSVPVCCEGYAIQEPVGNVSSDAKCVPACKKCRSGVCTAPDQCTCHPGFQGRECTVECPQGTWGQGCESECNCPREVACNPVDGKCECPAGWMGSRCENKCPDGQWGAGCNSICLCENPLAKCHHESGECIEPEITTTSAAAATYATTTGIVVSNYSPIDPFEASGISDNLVPSAKQPDTDYIDVIDFDREAVPPRITENDSVTAAIPSLPDEMIPVLSNNVVGPIAQQSTTTTEAASTKAPEEQQNYKPFTVHRPTSPLTPKLTSAIEGNQLSQPQPDVKKSNNGDNNERFEFDDRHNNFRVIVSPKTDFVKTTHKGNGGASMSSIPIDVAAMIVVGAIVSIGLTSVAALMIFHMRSRLLKAALSIYNQEKAERQFAEKEATPSSAAEAGKGLDLTMGTLPRCGTMTRANPAYNGSSDASSAILTFDDRPAEYANGTVTIGIRLSSNIRDLLESHYDRPAACSHRPGVSASMATGESTEVEHVYDEIPLSAPFYFAKNT